MLDYEKLDVYQCAIEFLALSYDLLQSLPRGSSQIADHLKRASLSVPLNIAEGYGVILNLVDEESFMRGKALLVRIVQMLVRMTQ